MRQQLWLEAFAECGSIGEACAATGIPVPTAEHWDSADSYGFKKRKAWAAQMALGKLDAEINRRAVEGIDHPIIYKGEITGSYKEYSDNLLMFRAKRLDPQYRDAYAPDSKPNVHITKIVVHVPAGLESPVVEATEFREMPLPADVERE
jgi:hypothetical protein